ncbi:type III secretion system chaperone [Pseudomonas entomophila]|uniref:type III secretion system chaperone n=1 Tax=Pseudomonas entomophila TaxID=312306 RepID=UPI001EFFDEA3|nr:type III secretion system chaperone [Pseudomonas entomophila]MCG8291420.1 type III secretion system chaperone [Pseudomonas entomophila]
MVSTIGDQLQSMGLPSAFDRVGTCVFSLQREDGCRCTVTLVSDPDAMKLYLILQSWLSLPEKMSRTFFLAFARRSLEPLRGGQGIGLYPESEQLTLYRVLDLHDGVELETELIALVEAVAELEGELLA